MPEAYLALENGLVFKGSFFGAERNVTGEIVFTTGMTGYLETLTDPSYYGQIVLQTFPLVGNYGVIPADFESERVGVAGYIAKHPCLSPSNFRSEGELDSFLRSRGVAGIHGIDTRAITRIIRVNGVMNGCITKEEPSPSNIQALKDYSITKAVQAVSCKHKVLHACRHPKFTIALLDLGMKQGILNELQRRGCSVWVFPCDSSPEDIKKVAPDGIMLSNGPGNPADNPEIIKTIAALLEDGIPLFGICLGHQLLALANGFSTEKLKYGHRGANQPVKDMQTGRVYITSQNHGYTVMLEGVSSAVATPWFVNANDGTCEGLMYKTVNACSVQFHPEARSGPQDTAFLFDHFIQAMEKNQHATQ